MFSLDCYFSLDNKTGDVVKKKQKKQQQQKKQRKCKIPGTPQHLYEEEKTRIFGLLKNQGEETSTPTNLKTYEAKILGLTSEGSVNQNSVKNNLISWLDTDYKTKNVHTHTMCLDCLPNVVQIVYDNIDKSCCHVNTI